MQPLHSLCTPFSWREGNAASWRAPSRLAYTLVFHTRAHERMRTGMRVVVVGGDVGGAEIDFHADCSMRLSSVYLNHICMHAYRCVPSRSTNPPLPSPPSFSPRPTLHPELVRAVRLLVHVVDNFPPLPSLKPVSAAESAFMQTCALFNACSRPLAPSLCQRLMDIVVLIMRWKIRFWIGSDKKGKKIPRWVKIRQFWFSRTIWKVEPRRETASPRRKAVSPDGRRLSIERPCHVSGPSNLHFASLLFF